MTANRRNFLFSAPAGILGLDQLSQYALAADRPKNVAEDVVDFWVRGMGLPSGMVVGGEKTRGRQAPTGPEIVGSFAREPVFLHFDKDEGVLITADQISPKKLTAAGDTQVDFQLSRLRLNPSDHRTFRDYTSGGIYVDFQQQPQPQKESTADLAISLASSLFSAIFPAAGGKSDGKTDTKKADPKSKGNAFAPQAKGGDKTAAAATAIPLQQAKQSQSIALPNGLGKAAFSCFAKDRRKTAFGQFISAITQATGSSASYLQLLSLPTFAGPALTAIRALVANLQAQGGDQQSIVQSPPIDVSATGAGCDLVPGALRLRTGSYIAVPREHASALKDKLNSLKLLDGFLVPKEATSLDIFDVAPQTMPGVTYLSIEISVKKAKPANCLVGS